MSVLKVGDEFRTNDLSLIPGGKTVTVIYQNGKKLIYDKIKSPGKYIKSISEKVSTDGKIVEILVNGKQVWNDSETRSPWDI
jgi:hypothetical protein